MPAFTDDDWLTPPHILRALGPFDLDPCAPAPRPWDTAATHYTIADNGLAQPWFGRVWYNPPYSKLNGKSQLNLWLQKLAAHRGIALTNVRTETGWCFDWVWNTAHAVFFFKGRLKFYRPDGTQGDTGKNASFLAAYSAADAAAIFQAGFDGKFIPLILDLHVELRTTWKQLIRYLLREAGGRVTLEQLYALVASHPKAAQNPNWKAKVRQQVQAEAIRIGAGTWQQTLTLT